MPSLVIEGRAPLSGEIHISGNKNAALPMIAAAMLTSEPVVLHNVPNIIDVRVMLEVAQALGADVSFEDGRLEIRAATIRSTDISRELASKIRTSMLFCGPMLAREPMTVSLWPPGGDVIGRRRLDAHFYGLGGLGVKIEADTLPFTFTSTGPLTAKELFLDEASVTATEHILMAAVLARGTTYIRNAACEPHVTDLARLLNKMGANVTGLDTNTLRIEGVERLHGAEHTVVEDHVEAASFLALAAATGGEMTLTGVRRRHYWMTHRIFERFGVNFEMLPGQIHLAGGQELSIRPDFGNSIPVVSDGPWPQFPSDMMSCTIVMATQARGTVLFFEKMFESRIYFVDRLIAMGANAVVCDPHRVVISGPANLRGITMASPDIRAGMAMVIAALCAEGTSTIKNAEVIERGYSNLHEKLLRLGARVREIPS
ncbi:UDP-N-acetylglucosamine 1-carboxyvinyltransferase [Myxococcota bacterium]|nr:UDP-N-acetylglucosamine 1-carboxyvinyltransferase [Myxococcota bacterium]MBU1536113.1 UDP-N-acetylglucosamine 1-carboxyvinyltransferase [Myxococcota bacterium]